MAVVTDNFDSYSNGADLNGSGNWVGTSSEFTVTNTTSNTSPNAVTWSSNLGATITNTVTGASTGSQVVWMRCDAMAANTDEQLTTFRDASNNLAGDVRIRKIAGAYDAELRAGSTVTLQSGISTATWYRFEFEWDTSRNSGNGQVRARIGTSDVSPGTFSAWTNGFATFGNITKVQLRVSLDAGTNTLYWDTFKDGAAAPVNSNQAFFML